MRRCFLALLLAVFPAASNAREYPNVGNWRVFPFHTGCAIEKGFAGPGETYVTIILPFKNKPTIVMVTNTTWSVVANQMYDIRVNLFGFPYATDLSMGIVFDDRKGYLTVVAPGFIDQLVKHPSFSMSRGDKDIEHMELAQADAAVLEAQRCVKNEEPDKS